MEESVYPTKTFRGGVTGKVNILSYSARAAYNKRILYLSFYHFCRGRKKDGLHL